MLSDRGDLYRLSFLLPEGASLEFTWDGWSPTIEGCGYLVHGAGLVVVTAPSREAALDTAGDFLRAACRGLGARSVALTLLTPDGASGPRGRDRWTAVVGANVAFFPTGLGPYLPRSRAPPPADRLDGTVGEVGTGVSGAELRRSEQGD